MIGLGVPQGAASPQNHSECVTGMEFRVNLDTVTKKLRIQTEDGEETRVQQQQEVAVLP